MGGCYLYFEFVHALIFCWGGSARVEMILSNPLQFRIQHKHVSLLDPKPGHDGMVLDQMQSWTKSRTGQPQPLTVVVVVAVAVSPLYPPVANYAMRNGQVINHAHAHTCSEATSHRLQYLLARWGVNLAICLGTSTTF